MPFLVCESRYMARNQVVRGSLVARKRVPASSEVWRLQWLHWKVVRRVESRQKRAEPQRGQESLPARWPSPGDDLRVEGSPARLEPADSSRSRTGRPKGEVQGDALGIYQECRIVPPMSLEALPALAGIAVSMTWAPGPNNAMLSASGANYGWRRSVPHVMGVAVGFPVMLILVSSGLVRVLDAFPAIVETLGWIGFVMLAWLVWRIATAAGATEGIQGSPLTFLEAIAFQWVNPKAWALAIYITAGYAVGRFPI